MPGEVGGIKHQRRYHWDGVSRGWGGRSHAAQPDHLDDNQRRSAGPIFFCAPA